MRRCGLIRRATGRTRRPALCALGVLIALVCGTVGVAIGAESQQLPTGVKVITRTAYYDVHGASARELAADLRRQGPRDAEGRTQAGAASSPVRWQYVKRASGSECRAASVRVIVHTDILLPRWVPPVDTEPGLPAQWTAFIAALAVHEQGHQEISVRHAERIRKGIAAMRANCRSFDGQVERANKRVMTAMRSAQAAYDADTRHGLTQGTGFPPRPAPPANDRD